MKVPPIVLLAAAPDANHGCERSSCPDEAASSSRSVFNHNHRNDAQDGLRYTVKGLNCNPNSRSMGNGSRRAADGQDTETQEQQRFPHS
ncbi:MAG: hypothetical protein WB762_35300 [Candidatus Sulfotelmatobacter sp.]